MDWITVILSLIVGGTFGALGMGVLSGRAYEKGREDVLRVDDDHLRAAYSEGYRHAYEDFTLADGLGDQVVFEGPDQTKEDEK